MRRPFFLTAALVLVAVHVQAEASTPTCDGKRATIVGTSGRDVIQGTDGDDVIVGGPGGGDTVHAGSGNDRICVGPRSWVYGEDGNDFLSGPTNSMYGGRGNDRIVAYGGNGEEGNDTLIPYGHFTIVYPAVYFHGGPGNDTLIGSDTTYDEYDFRDLLFGGDGDDIIKSGAGGDFIWPGFGHDRVDGGSGRDRVSYADLAQPVRVNLKTHMATNGDDPLASGGGVIDDYLNGIQDIDGTALNDDITGDDHNNYLDGCGGRDVINGLGGDDSLDGGDSDFCDEEQDSTFRLDLPDQIDGGPGHDGCSEVLATNCEN